MRGLRSRIIALSIVLWSDFFSDYILNFITLNEAYLFACVNFSFLTLLFLLRNKPTSIMVDISLLMFSQMCIHIIAWVTMIFFSFPYFYHDSIVTIVIITYLRLIWIGKNDGNILEYPNWLVFCRNYNLVKLFATKVRI